MVVPRRPYPGACISRLNSFPLNRVMASYPSPFLAISLPLFFSLLFLGWILQFFRFETGFHSPQVASSFLCCWGWPWTSYPPTSAPWVLNARIIDFCHIIAFYAVLWTKPRASYLLGTIIELYFQPRLLHSYIFCWHSGIPSLPLGAWQDASSL